MFDCFFNVPIKIKAEINGSALFASVIVMTTLPTQRKILRGYCPISSNAWEHFTKKKKGNVCNYCGVVFSKKTSTTVLTKHTDTKHFEKIQPLSKLWTSFTTIPASQKAALDAALVDMAVLDGLPFSFVESDGFLKFIQDAIPGYIPLTRQKLSKDVAQRFSTHQLEVIYLLMHFTII